MSTTCAATTTLGEENIKQKSLMEVLFESEVSTESLILLKEKNKDLSTLSTQLGVQEQTLSSHLKLLQDYHLIGSHNDTYELTTIARLLVDKLKPLIDTLDKAEIIKDHVEDLDSN